MPCNEKGHLQLHWVLRDRSLDVTMGTTTSLGNLCQRFTTPLIKKTLFLFYPVFSYIQLIPVLFDLGCVFLSSIRMHCLQ